MKCFAVLSVLFATVACAHVSIQQMPAAEIENEPALVEADKKKRKKVVVVTVTKTSSRSGNPSRGLIEQEATKDEEKVPWHGRD